MTALRTDEILRYVERINASEMKRRRDYYDHLASKEPQTETFEEHVAKFANLVRTGDTATLDEIRAFETAQSTTFPGELQEFHQTFGRLHAYHTIEIFSVAELQSMRSMGLIDMMSACWGHDRPEFDPAEGMMTREEIDALNAAYKCVGWIWSDPGEEGHDYIWFDRDGRFGVTFFHQDAFDELYEEALVPMMARSPGSETLSDIILRALGAR